VALALLFQAGFYSAGLTRCTREQDIYNPRLERSFTKEHKCIFSRFFA
jgi:hypothetical protein